MNDKLQQIYDLYKSKGLINNTDFNTFSTADASQIQKLYNLGKSNGLFNSTDLNTFSSAFTPVVKKKEVSQSIFDQGGFSSAMSKMAQNQPSVSSVEKPKKKKEEIFTGYPGQEDKKYKLDSDKGFPVWKEYSSTDYDKKTGKQVDKFEEQITNPSRVAELNRHFNVDASTDAIEQVYTNYSEDKKDNEYRVTDNKWQRKVPGATEWTNIINEGSISALNTRYNKNVKFNPEAEYVKPEPKLKFNDVNTSLMANTEETAQKVLSDKYGKYGFTFEQDGYLTDYITVSNKDETKKITVGFDEKNPEEALKLRTFLEQNASKPKSNTATILENKIKDFNSQKYYSGKGGMEMGENKDLLKYIKSDEYAEQLKSLTYDEVKDQFEEFIKPSFTYKNDHDEIYKSKAYEVYKNKKKQEYSGRNSKVDALYTELRSVSGNYKKEKEVKAKINAYLTDDVIQDQVKDYSMQLNDLNNAAKKLEKEKKAYTQLVSDFNGRVPSMSQEEYNAAKKDLEDKAESIGTKADSLMIAGKSIQKDQKKLNIIAGEYVTEKSKAGSFGGGLVNSFLNGVSKTFLEVPYELGQSIAFSSDYFRLSPEEKKFYKDKGYSEDQVTNLLKNKELKDFKSGTRKAIVDIAGADQTTEEYMKSEDRGFFEKAIYGVAESAPAMLLGAAGATASFAGLAAQSYSSIEDEMLSDPDFETSSAGERAVISVPYSILMGVLENYGLKNTIKGESFTGGLMKNIMVKVADKMPANATREALEALYNKEIKSLIGKGVFKIVNGAVAEFETGATQALVLDIGLKSVYNKMIQSGMTEEEVSNLSGGELFSTPDTFGGIASTVLEDGLAEAIGGATISTFSTVASGLINGNISLYNEKDLEFLKEVAGDKGFKGLIVANLKADMLKGKLTKSEAQEKLQAMNELESTINSVPDNLSPTEQIDSVNMIVEKNRLTKEIQGKDPALVTAQTERINVINEELKNISKLASTVEAERVATAESTTQGITEEGQKEEQEVSQKEIDDYKSSLTRKIEYAEKNGGDIYLEEYKTDLKELNEDPNTFFAKKRIDDEIRDVQIQSNRTRADLADKVKSLMDKRNALESEKRNSILFTKKNELKSINEEIKKTEDELTAHNTKESNDVSKLEKRKALEVERVATETTTTSNTQEVEVLRAKEQEEIRAKFPNAEYKADGKIDADKLSAKDRKAFDKIYAKYDKLISPLLKPTEITIDKPVIAKNAAVEVDRVKALPVEAEDGATFNLDGAKYEGVGLVVPVDSMNTTIEELTPEMVADFVEERQKMIGDAGVVKAGIYKFPNSNQVSIDLSIVVPESSREQAIEFGRLADQESLFDLATYENVKTGGTGNNPMKFTPEQHREIAKALKEGRLPNVFTQADNRTVSDQDNLITQDNFEEQRSKQTTAMGQRIVTAAKLVMKALPGIKIYVHQTTAEFENGIGQKLTKASKGAYDNGEIHINLESGADLSTLYHEAIHYALEVKGIESGAILDLAKGLQSIVSDKSVKERLSNLIEVYNENEKAEEYIVELGAIMAEAKKELTTTKFQQFKNLINRIAKKLGLPVIFSASANAKNAVDFMNSLIKAIRTGEEIKAEEVTKKGKIKFQYDFSDPLSKLTFVYDKNGEKFNKLKKEGYITDDKNLSDFEGKFIFLHQPDAAFSGMIYKDGEILVEGKGGVFYPIKFHDDGYFWAGTNITSEKMTKDLNKVFDQNNGTIYMALTSAPYDKLMSSTTMSNAVLDFFSSKAFDNNFKITPAQLKVALRKAANDVKIKKSKDEKTGGIKEKKEGLDLRIKAETSLDDIQSQIKTALGYDNSSFADRKNFALELIKLMAENIKNNPKATEQFGKLFSEGIQNKYFKGVSKTGKLSISATNMTQAISEMFTEPLLKEDIKRESGGQVYAIIELNSKVKQEPSTKHESYPIAIESENKNNKVKIHILQDRKNWADSFIDPETGETVSKDRQLKLFPTSGVSVMGLQLKGKSNIKFQRISPENSSNYANLTEDGKGNFVFFHIGGNDYEVIKKNSGGTTATSRDEASAISKVGGVAMYYTRPTDSESMVSGTSQYAVKVKNDKVYDFNSDPLNIIKEARDRFNREYPGQAFNPNVQFAYVTKIANEKGYDMTVAEWEGRTRAQSVVEFKPDDVQVTKGNQVVKNFDESYESNTDKGFQSVIPEDKQKKLDAVYAKIYSVRNSEGRYDDLYRLQEESAKLTEDQITDMIVKSDLSQEIKDEYQAVISAPVEKRRTIKFQRVTKVTVNEMAALKDQIRLEARAARQAKADLNAKRKMLAAAINKMAKLGSIKAKQAEVLLKRISTINLDNPVMVERFTDYAGKVFNKADYQNTLTNAFALRKSIRRLLKTDNQAQVVGMAREFAQIDPSMVEDIDAYIDMANTVKTAVKPTVQKGFNTVMKEAANIAKVSEYSKKIIAAQEEMKSKELIATYDYLQDISKGLSFKELQDIVNILKEKQDANPDNQSKVMDFLKVRMNTMAGILESMLKSGVDPITGEEITFDENQKELMKRVLKIDLSEMDIRSAIRIVEGIDNFLNNQITSGLEAAASSYEGDVNAKSLVARGKVARKLKLFFSGAVGRLYSEQLFSLPNLMEKMFGGVNNSIDVMRKMGLVSLINGVNKANRLHNDIVDIYSKQSFYSTKGFMDAANVYERGMIAFLKRNLIGTESEMKAEFERRARIIKETIDTLREDGGATENKMADMYEEAYNKLGVDKMDLDVVLANASNSNLEAVDWWINEWTKYYQELSDVSLSVYNTMLGSDLNYTPDKYKPLSSETLEEGTINQNGAFASDMNFTDKNKTGVLMESTRPKVLPKGRYISLDFDTNNSKALKAALVDINTAASIRQVDGFINSKAFKKLIPESADRKILTKRINSYIKRAKGKNIVPSDTMQYVDKLTSYITSLGVGKALAGLNQTIMQTTPVMVNTLINAGRFDFATADFNQWLNETGMPISNRGLESQSTIESIDRRIEAKGQRIQETLRGVADLNQWYLKQLLVKPDVWVARSSFKSYYLQNLKRRGISTDIDWTNHEMDQEAAEYAQIMVDRQQNISDPLLAGEFLSSDNPMSKISRKIFLPFASFILNQKARMYNDLMTITSKTASKEDRLLATRSLAGLAAELTVYQALGYGIRNLYDMIASSLLGDDDEEEKNKKFLGLDVTKQQYNATKYPVKAFFNDIVSPLPIMDGATTWTLNKALEFLPYLNNSEIKEAVKERNKILEIKGEDPMDEKTEAKFIENLKEEAKYQVFDDDFSRAFGMIGIATDTYKELGEVSKLAVTGEFTDEYQGRETLKKLLPEDKEKIQYTILPMLLYSTGLMPKDIGAVSKKYINKIKQRAVTEKQYERFDEVQKELGRDLKSWEIDMVKGKKEVGTAVDELNFVKRNGGLTESQGREYVKLIKLIGMPTVSDLDRIQRGEKADQILK